MKIVVAADHRGFDKKQWLAPLVREWGHEVTDIGCGSAAACDYPDFAFPAAQSVAGGKADIGLLLDHSGIGMCIVANKVAGVRAALVLDEVSAKLAREANHANVLCLATELLSDAMMVKIVKTFLSAQPEVGRHVRRVSKLSAIEEQTMKR